MSLKRFLGTAVLLAVLLPPLPALSLNELLIIAPDGFIDELRPLMRFKEASGRPTTLVSLTQVTNNPQCSGADLAEQVKRCIALYENSLGIEHVLLVGDVDRFPVRHRWWGLPGQEGWAVSDLYYADLYKNGTKTFDDWDANNNGLYAEIEFEADPGSCAPNCRSINNDDIDFLPDVSVGRIPASTGAEVAAYVNKVIAYEMRTTDSDAWFKQAALYTGTWVAQHNSLKNDVAGYLANAGFTSFIKRYTDWTNPSKPVPPPGVPGVIIGDLNAGVGFANYAGHGNGTSWACVSLGSQNLTGLNNANTLPVAFAAACDTGMFAWLARFHPYLDVNGQQHCGTDNGESLPPGPYPYLNLPRPAPIQTGSVSCPGPLCTNCQIDRPCIAESFLFGNPVGPTGAIAYVGSRSGTRPNQSIDLDRHFFQAYEDGHNIMGNLWKEMIVRYYNQHNLSQSQNWVRTPSQWEDGHTFDEPQKYILFGDPSLVVGGAFSTVLSAQVYDGAGGPLASYSRYRIRGDAAVPAGSRLSVQPSSSVLFETGSTITARDSDPVRGLVVNATAAHPVGFLGSYTNSGAVNRGIVVKGQLRLRNGGAMRFH
jgi:hypothetical protein